MIRTTKYKIFFARPNFMVNKCIIYLNYFISIFI